jgi:adenosylhomocysteine nucleosidase
MKRRIDTLVVTPMDKEHDAFMRCLGGRLSWSLLDGVLVSTSGVGKVNAAICVSSMVELARPDIKCVISVGCAGALSPKLKIGDIVVCSESAYWDVDCGSDCRKGQVQGLPPVFPADRRLSAKIAKSIRDSFKGVGVHRGKMLTGDRFFEEPGSEKWLHSEYPSYLTVDMETAAIAQSCFRLNIPYASVRVVSDTYDGDRGAEYSAFWRSVSKGGFGFAKPLMEAVAFWRKGLKA